MIRPTGAAAPFGGTAGRSPGGDHRFLTARRRGEHRVPSPRGAGLLPTRARSGERPGPPRSATVGAVVIGTGARARPVLPRRSEGERPPPAVTGPQGRDHASRGSGPLSAGGGTGGDAGGTTRKAAAGSTSSAWNRVGRSWSRSPAISIATRPWPHLGSVIEAAPGSGTLHVRDSKYRAGPVVSLTPEAWAGFVGFASRRTAWGEEHRGAPWPSIRATGHRRARRTTVVIASRRLVREGMRRTCRIREGAPEGSRLTRRRADGGPVPGGAENHEPFGRRPVMMTRWIMCCAGSP